MADFELLCKEKVIKFYVLPPRSSKWKDIDDIKMNSRGFLAFYNNIRPHQNLGLLTPCQFIEKLI